MVDMAGMSTAETQRVQFESNRSHCCIAVEAVVVESRAFGYKKTETSNMGMVDSQSVSAAAPVATELCFIYE